MRGDRLIVACIDQMPRPHDLGRTPSLIDAQVGDDVRSLEAAVAAVSNYGGNTSNQSDAIDCSRAAHFSGDRRRETVAELGGISGNHPATVTGVGRRGRIPIRARRVAVEVEERLRQTEREAGPLDEGAVRVD